jgi:hypothetical protein
MLVIELITSGASIIYVNTKCVWSIPHLMEAPQKGRQGHTHQVSCYYFCSYYLDIQKRLTWLVCGSPFNYHSVLSPATCLGSGFTAHYYVCDPRSDLYISTDLVPSWLFSQSCIQTLKMTSLLQCHCAQVRA